MTNQPLEMRNSHTSLKTLKWNLQFTRAQLMHDLSDFISQYCPVTCTHIYLYISYQYQITMQQKMLEVIYYYYISSEGYLNKKRQDKLIVFL